MLTILFVILIFNVLNSKTMKRSQGFILIIRILINLSFLIIISVIKTIIIINNNNNSHKLFKSNNVHYQKLVNFYKLSTKTQMNLLNRIILVNKTQMLTIMIITKVRLSFIIMNFNDDLLLKHINIMSKVKKIIYR